MRPHFHPVYVEGSETILQKHHKEIAKILHLLYNNSCVYRRHVLYCVVG